MRSCDYHVTTDVPHLSMVRDKAYLGLWLYHHTSPAGGGHVPVDQYSDLPSV